MPAYDRERNYKLFNQSIIDMKPGQLPLAIQALLAFLAQNFSIKIIDNCTQAFIVTDIHSYFFLTHGLVLFLINCTPKKQYFVCI